jgi:hypothetical protein
MSARAGFTLEPDREQLARFIGTLFQHAEEGGFVSLRAFFDDEQAKKRGDGPFKIRTVRLNGGGLAPVIDAAFRLATEAAAATRPVVVSPPIATFKSGKADEKNLIEGLALTVEMDERAAQGLTTLRAILGPPTVVMESGGEWTDPHTGEVHPKLHIHWRLKEPTQTPEEHARLKRARALACDLVGADASSKTIVHCLRWAGSIHRKNPAAPRLAQIVEENAGAEIDLEDALAELEGLAALHGATDGRPGRSGENPTADDNLLMACARLLPNPLPPKPPETDKPRGHWDDWNRIGMAFWRASSGSEAGFQAFDAFSKKNAKKYDAEATRARWEHYRTSPPTSIGIGALVYEVRRVEPDFLRRKEPGDDWKATLAAAIEEMNARYFVTALSGKGVIAALAFDDGLRRERLVFSREQDIRLLYRRRHYQTGVTKQGNAIWKDLGTAWIEDWRRRTYQGIALIPKGPTPPDVFNLWRGFGVEPTAGDWPLLRQHILDVVCDGKQEHFDYLVGWCAYCVQHPEKQAEVAVVLRGEKGTGKGTFAQVMIEIFNHHALHVSNSRHVSGNFNAHLVDVLLLFLDEAFWAGDKQGEGTLKALITEKTIPIEPKGIDLFTVPNRLKILMASNADWVVPASADERRYFVLDVSNKKQGDYDYFEELHQALGEGETAAFLAHLLSMDLSAFKIRNVPHTTALNRQKLISADSVTAFWHDCLKEGVIVGTGTAGWPEDIVTQVLHAAYLDHARDHGERHPMTDARMIERLTQLCEECGVKRIRPRKPEEGQERPWRYALGSLDKHRTAFLKAMRIREADYEWPIGEETADA